MNIKAIIFDFGKVLNAPVDPEVELARRDRLAKKLNLRAEELWSYLFEGETARLWMTGQLDWDAFWRTVLAPHGITEPAKIEAFATEVFAENDQLHPEMVTLLEELRGRYKLAILSNHSWKEKDFQTKLYHELGMPVDLFDAVVTSTTVGAVKPDPAFYLHILDRLDVRPEEAIFTDDMPNFTDSAAKLGIHAHAFTSPAAFREFLVDMGVLQT